MLNDIPVPAPTVADRVLEATFQATWGNNPSWEHRVLAAAAEASAAALPPTVRDSMACLVADALLGSGATTTRELLAAVEQAWEATTLTRTVSPHLVRRVAWRVALDLWDRP